MSLVNDLLIEIDRRRGEAEISDRQRLSGLTPRPSTMAGRIGFAPIALFASGIMLCTAAAFLIGSNSQAPTIGTQLPQARPAVSARRVDQVHVLRPGSIQSTQATERAGGSAASPALRSTTTVEIGPSTLATKIATEREEERERVALRPVAVESVSISREAHTTRLRIMAKESAAYRIEESEKAFDFEVILEAASLVAPISDLNLLGTPIRSIRAHVDGRNLRLALSLDRAVRLQSQWIWHDYAAVLVIDIQDSGRETVEATAHSINSSFAPTDVEAIDIEFNEPFEASKTLERRAESADDSGKERPVSIARSEGDQHRDAQRALRDRAHRILEAARIARTQGRSQEAKLLYQDAIETLPGFRDAILESAAFLAESNEVADAIDLIRDARTKSPDDSGLTMLHATIIAEVGDLETAIKILDRSDHNITQAPDLHALAAAFLQQRGEHDLAIERYETILRRYPSEARWWMGLGISLEARERTAEALDVYRISVQLDELPSKARRWVSGRVTALGEEV